jgi:hypothetical protein
MNIQEILGIIPTLSEGDREQIRQSLATPSPAAPLRVIKQFGNYNQRRYSRPWIARVISWPVGGRPELEFGRYLGSDGGGECEIIARPGSIVRWGQNDWRGNNTDSCWGIVDSYGTIASCTEAQARAKFTGGLGNE